MRKVRVIVAKPGLDGHDRGAKVIARALRDAGMEVIYLGLRQTAEQIVAAAVQEDVDEIAPRLMQLLEERGLHDVLVLIGGIIPAVDLPHLRSLGIKGLFPPGTPIQQIVDFIHVNVRQVTEATT